MELDVVDGLPAFIPAALQLMDQRSFEVASTKSVHQILMVAQAEANTEVQ